MLNFDEERFRSIQSGAVAPNPESQLKVLRREGANFKVVGEADIGSVGEKEVAGRSIDIPVQIGDILGYKTAVLSGPLYAFGSASVRRAAAHHFPESEVDRTCRGHRENGAHDPNPTSQRVNGRTTCSAERAYL